MSELDDFTEDNAEAVLRERLGENDYLLDLWQIGEQMALFKETTAGALLEKTFRDDFMAATRKLLAIDDPGSPEGRAAHAEARLNLRLLSKIEETLAAGKQAESIMTDQPN